MYKQFTASFLKVFLAKRKTAVIPRAAANNEWNITRQSLSSSLEHIFRNKNPYSLLFFFSLCRKCYQNKLFFSPQLVSNYYYNYYFSNSMCTVKMVMMKWVWSIYFLWINNITWFKIRSGQAHTAVFINVSAANRSACSQRLNVSPASR